MLNADRWQSPPHTGKSSPGRCRTFDPIRGFIAACVRRRLGLLLSARGPNGRDQEKQTDSCALNDRGRHHRPPPRAEPPKHPTPRSRATNPASAVVLAATLGRTTKATQRRETDMPQQFLGTQRTISITLRMIDCVKWGACQGSAVIGRKRRDEEGRISGSFIAIRGAQMRQKSEIPNKSSEQVVRP
jgi:hypothetical protein